MIEVVQAPPFAMIQDLGWNTGRAMGLPRGGAMDPASLWAANEAVGNLADAAGIEWALGSGTLRFEREGIVAVAAGAEARLEDRLVAPGTPIEVKRGSLLRIAPRAEWRFGYLAVRGGIAVPILMGSRSTYLPGGFGGHQGRRLQSGDRLPIGPADSRPAGPGGSARGVRPPEPSPSSEALLRVTRGPQWECFDDAARRAFFDGRFTVAPESDRMGYRLNGPVITPRQPATLPSEAACPGAVQLPDGGQPIVLMPDGPTVGGYPKLAVVIEADLRLLAQRQPGAGVRFVEVTLAEARRAGAPRGDPLSFSGAADSAAARRPRHPDPERE